MNCDWPAGVMLASWLDMVTVVLAPARAVVTVTWTGRYWSSLFPPRLMSETSTERGARLPLTPLRTQAA